MIKVVGLQNTLLISLNFLNYICMGCVAPGRALQAQIGEASTCWTDSRLNVRRLGRDTAPETTRQKKNSRRYESRLKFCGGHAGWLHLFAGTGVETRMTGNIFNEPCELVEVPSTTTKGSFGGFVNFARRGKRVRGRQGQSPLCFVHATRAVEARGAGLLGGPSPEGQARLFRTRTPRNASGVEGDESLKKAL